MGRRIERTKEQFRQDFENLKTLRGKKRVQFIWDYYKIPLLAAAFVLVFLILALVIRAPKKDTAVYVVWLNGIAQQESSYFDDLLQKAGFDTEKQHVDVNTTLSMGVEGNEAADAQTLQVLSALFGIGDLDLFLSDPEYFDRYAARDAFKDLSELLRPEVLDALREHAAEQLYYVTNGDGQEIIAGYRITKDSGAAKAGYLAEGAEAVAGILENALNQENAVRLLEEMILEDLGER